MFALFEIKSKWQFRATDESAQQVLFVSGGNRFVGQARQLVDVIDQATDGCDAFAVSLNPFGRVQFRSVGRQKLQMDIADLHAPLPQEFSLVLIQVIQQDHQRSAERPPQSPEVSDQVVLVHAAVREKLGIQAAPPPCGRNRQRTEYCHLFPMSQSVPDDRSLADGSPGAADIGMRQEPGFVEENEGRPEPAGFF